MRGRKKKGGTCGIYHKGPRVEAKKNSKCTKKKECKKKAAPMVLQKGHEWKQKQIVKVPKKKRGGGKGSKGGTCGITKGHEWKQGSEESFSTHVGGSHLSSCHSFFFLPPAGWRSFSRVTSHG
jgi:hypothetical protein